MSKWKLLALIAGVWFVGDQVTKYLAVEHLTAAFTVAGAHDLGDKVSAFVSQKDLLERGLASPVPVTVAPFWQHRYTQNRGAAWGVLAGAGEKFRVPFFYLVSLVAVIFICSSYRKLSNHQRYLQVALALVRAVREALANVERHAGVRDATLSIHAAEDRVVVAVDDTGVGFCPGEVPYSRRGIRGSVVERMTAAGGSASTFSKYPAA